MNWPIKQLGDLVDDITAGKSFGASNAPAEQGQWGIIKVSAMTSGTFRPDENKAVPADRVDPRFEIREGDLLLSRANTVDYVGASVLIGPVRPKLLLSDKSLRLTPKSDVHPKWLWHVLQAPPARRQIRELATGTKDSMRNISQSALRRISIPLPPPAEQLRIVEVLEDHLSRLDAAHDSVKGSLRRLGALLDAALSDIVEQAEHSRGVVMTTIGSLAKVGSGMTPLKGNPAFYEGGTIPWITSGDLHQGVITKATQFVTQAALDETTLKIAPAGSLLIAMYGEGKTRGTVAELGIDATTNQACAAIILHDPELKSWVHLVLAASYRRLRQAAAGGVQPNLNLSIVKSIAVPLPATELRVKLVERYAELVDTADRLRRALEATESHSAALRRSLLRAAFKGELADQDPSDEPAEVALRRLESAPKPVRQRAARPSAALATRG